VHKGQIWANSHQLHLLLDTLTNAGPARVPGARGVGLLTNREAQVMQLITEGMTNREISLLLGITEHTVSNYLFRIFNKLGVSTRLELALYALKQPQDDGLKNSKKARAARNIPSAASVRKPTNKGTLTRSA
jgi:DNA-binding NarL/FixJ family response regulator